MQTEKAKEKTACKMQAAQFVEKASLFHKLCPYFKWKRGLAPFSKPFSPCSPGSF
mgnify:CR=1 FL=1